MRAIKFRAWDGVLMHTVSCLSWVMGGLRFDGPGVGTGWIKGTVDYEQFPRIKEEPHAILMQYTGLKDKNGQEIYEGDIIVADWHYTEPTEVVFNRFIYWVEECALDGEDIEVIGNIHENPDFIR